MLENVIELADVLQPRPQVEGGIRHKSAAGAQGAQVDGDKLRGALTAWVGVGGARRGQGQVRMGLAGRHAGRQDARGKLAWLGGEEG